ncbi:MAG: 2-dehydropantoate 2-reductase [Mogibacterium sp.]|nr:2-dehydropantoate 2-reductase [Mogibacterium sp.]
MESDQRKLKYLIIGTGGTGGAVGAHLAYGGKDVTFIARGRHLETMRENGLKVIRPDTEFTVRPARAFSMEECSEDLRPDVILVCVKGYSIADTIPFISKIAGPDTLVIPILNIFGTGGEMQKELLGITVTDGCIYVASEVWEPGVIFMNGTILRVVFGLRKDQRERLAGLSGCEQEQAGCDLISRLKQVEEDLNACGIRGILSDNIERDAMRKFSYVSPQGACGLYYDIPAGPMQKEGEARDCFAGMIGEIAKLADAMGIGFESDVVSESLRILDGLAPDMTTSLQRDVAAGKSTEIDGLIYNVLTMAEKYGVDLPIYRKVVAELKSRGIR